MLKLSEKRAELVGLQHRLDQKLAGVDVETATDADLTEIEGLTATIESLTAEIANLTAEPEPTSGDKSMSASLHKKAPQQFNLNKFILALADKSYAGGGFEIEMSQEAARLSGKDSSTPIIPWGAFTNKAAQDAITPPSGGKDLGISLAQPRNHDDLFTITSAASFMASAAGQLGVPIYQADLGGFKVPRMVTPVTPAWVARDTDLPNSNGEFDALSATPHTLGAVVQINRSALIDCAPPMQQVISDALWAAVLNALDNALLGAPLPLDADAPQGLYQKLVGGANDFGADTPSELLFSLAKIADKNTNPLGFIASNVWGAYASTTAINASLSQRSLLDSMPANYSRVLNGRMNAFDAAGTPAPTGGELNLHSFFGPFSTYAMTVLFGGGIELMVNPYAATVYQKGAILVRAVVDADILIRDASRFGMSFQATA